MLADYLKSYRNLITLKDGARVLLRPLVPEDRKMLIDLFAAAAPDDTKYLRDPITDAEHVGGWVDDLDYSRVVPLVAMAQDRLVGDATLHFLRGPQRHMGELRIFLSKDYRRRGLGTHMLRTLIDLSHGLEQQAGAALRAPWVEKELATDGVLSGTTTVTASGGVATFSDLSLTRAASGYTLVASGTAPTAVTSASSAVSPAGPEPMIRIFSISTRRGMGPPRGCGCIRARVGRTGFPE